MSALVSRMEHSTIVEGQRLGTVHIMEGTCSRPCFSREMSKMSDMDMYMCVYVCVFFFFCLVPCHVVCRASLLVGWLGVVWCG